MKIVELVSVCVRLLAINLVFSNLVLIFDMVQTVRRLFPATTPDRWVILMGVAIALAVFLSALLFWLFPIRIARFIVPRETNSDLNISLTAEQLEVVSLSLIGVWVLIDAVPQLVHLVVWFAAAKVPSQDPGAHMASLVFRVVQILIGGFLVFRSVGLRRIINELRTMGT